MTTTSADLPSLPWAVRVELWDAALEAVRASLRAGGMREVSTPIRGPEVAIEPWIEPIAAGRGRYLATSPELAMKGLLARGAPSMFQIAHVFRAAEIGAQHSEEFHLIEWYRSSGQLPDVQGDVEAVIEAVYAAVASVLAGDARWDALRRRAAASRPTRWRRVKTLDLLGETLGVELAGNEPAEVLLRPLSHVRARAGVGLHEREDAGKHAGGGTPAAPPEPDPELERLEAWTELFSLWSDLYLDPWLAGRGPNEAVHVVDFPQPLAALAEYEQGGPPHVAARFESHVGAVELANGYRELREAGEQRRRFELVARSRAHHGLPPLPVPELFLAQVDALPPCAGVALGLDRLLARAVGCDRLDAISLDLHR